MSHARCTGHDSYPPEMTVWARSSSKATLALVMALVTACGSGEAEPGSPSGTGQTSQAGAPGVSSPLPIPPASLALLLPEASDFEKDLIEDARISVAEYEAAKLAEVACLRTAGVTVQEPVRLDGLYKYRLVLSYPAGRPELSNAARECNKEHSGVIDRLWAEVSVPLYQRTISESRRLMAECYRQNGLKVDERPQDSTDPAVQERYRACLTGMWAALDIEGVSFGVDGDGRPQ